MGKNLTKNREVADARDFYMRPRVRELLVRAVREPIKSVIVTAGAGYGKTQTISTFLDPENGDINERKTHRFWMQIFEMDNLVERFWVSFTKVIAPVNAPLAKRLTLLGFPESERKYERFSALVSAETSSEIRRIFVFDDFHLIENKAILRFFERFMESPFLNTALIFISRQEPRVNPAGLAERGMVFRIEEEDLRFSKDEMHSYLEAIGITLPAQEDTDIYNATGGWPLAVRLIGLALKNNLNRRDRALSSMKSGVFKFIETEIFAPLTNEEKKLLVRLALIDHLPPALLHELTGSEEKSAWAVLDKVSSFVRYDAYSDAFRAHRLFKEFLQRRCELLTSEEKRRVYSRAAKWCHENDFKSDAVTYYEKAGDYSGLADVAHALTRMTPGRVARFLLEALARAPEGAFEAESRLYVIRIKLLQSIAKFDEARDEALRVIAMYEDTPDTPEKHRLLAECHLNLGYIGIYTCLYTGEYDYTADFEAGYRHFVLGGKAPFGPRERTLVASYVCRVGYPSAPGTMERANRAFEQYAHFAEKAKNGMFGGMAALAECEAAYFKADIGNAEKLANIALIKARETEQFQVEHRALMFLLRINIHLANPAKLRELTRRLTDMLGNEEFLNRNTLHDIAMGWFYAQTRQTRLMPEWLKSEFEQSDLNSLSFGLEILVRAKYFLVEKRYHTVLATLENSGGEYGPEAFMIGRLEVAAMRAVCLYHVGEKSAAMDTLREAYEISAGDKLDMPFIELGRDMRTLAAVAQKSGRRDIPQKWLGMIQKKSSTYAKKLGHIISDIRERSGDADETLPLTVREKDILADICHGLSRSEIATSRGLSVNTVKASVLIIYKKLGAQNTADAIRIAVRRGLIP